MTHRTTVPAPGEPLRQHRARSSAIAIYLVRTHRLTAHRHRLAVADLRGYTLPGRRNGSTEHTSSAASVNTNPDHQHDDSEPRTPPPPARARLGHDHAQRHAHAGNDAHHRHRHGRRHDHTQRDTSPGNTATNTNSTGTARTAPTAATAYPNQSRCRPRPRPITCDSITPISGPTYGGTQVTIKRERASPTSPAPSPSVDLRRRAAAYVSNREPAGHHLRHARPRTPAGTVDVVVKNSPREGAPPAGRHRLAYSYTAPVAEVRPGTLLAG